MFTVRLMYEEGSFHSARDLGSVVTCGEDDRKWQLLFFSRSASMSCSSSGQRFADYFVVSGLDLVTGLEADQLSGL